MTSQKSDIEKIRYQLKKLNKSATNDEIRLAIDNYDGDFDPEKIALSMVSGLATIPTYNAISRDLKSEIKAMGIEISQTEIKEMVKDFRDFYNDTSEYLEQIKGFLSQYLQARNEKIQQFFQHESRELSSLISDKNDDFNRIIESGNSEINSLLKNSKIMPVNYSESLGELKNFLQLEI